jgi:K+-transporting ATPase ATPase A chain
MKINDFAQVLIYFSSLVLLVPLLGYYLVLVFEGRRHFMLRIFGPVEKLLYRFSGIDVSHEMNWKTYTRSLLLFNLAGFLFLFILLLTQNWLPLNPQYLDNLSWHLSLNTAISFVTNTNWQSYAGEVTMSYLVQMLGLTVQNFLSTATGIAVLLALIRGIIRKNANIIGNFWIDIIRSILYVLLPLSLLLALLLVGQGVVQNLKPYERAITLQGQLQTIPMGPAASQIAIKQLGTNGGGFFNANSGHPYENPTPFSNFLEMISILLIPTSLTFMFGRMVHSSRQGWIIFITMMILLIASLVISLYAEYHTTPLNVISYNMEGKETRFGITNSILWSVSTTAASNGSVNTMHDSLSPLSGMIAMINIMLGEVIFGGVGAGLYGMIVFIILTVFIAGLMIGRTPEYLGKKVEAFEVQMSIIAVIIPSASILLFAAIASSVRIGLSGITNSGPHGLSEILYAYSSAAGNNGSAFAGLNTNTVFYNLTLGLGMIAGRFGVIIPVMAIAGSLAMKKKVPQSSGTFRTDNWMFVGLLIAIILIVGGLTFFPVLSLAPVVEHLLLHGGSGF